MTKFIGFLALSLLSLTAASSCAARPKSSTEVRPTATQHQAAADPENPIEMTVDNMERLRSARDPDCNGNGIRDSIDIVRGFADDSNHNGEIDECDSDSLLAQRALTGERWWRFADLPDTSYFSVSHGYTPRITIRYTIPPSGAAVRLSVLDSTGSQLVNLVSQSQPNGVYVLQWDRKVRDQALKPGTYTFRLFVGRHRYSRTVGWSNW